MKYKYFVSFFGNSNKGSFIIGNAQIIRKRKITTFEDIKEITNNIEKDEKIEKVTIIDYKLLDERKIKK